MKQEGTSLTTYQQTMVDVWNKHMQAEFEMKDIDAIMDTMTEDPYVNNVPLLVGGAGWNGVKEFYSRHFLPQIPPDFETKLISRTINNERLIDELILKFTHTLKMDWILPGVAPTGRRVEAPLVVIVKFHNGKIANEHIYWDQASVLAQIGLIDSNNLPVSGIDSARKVLDPTLPSNRLIERARPGKR
jgi:carboxymethylenebutenolidase